MLNGAGEVSGLTQVQEWGLLETPILLTNTMAVGKVSDAAVKWMTKKWPRIGGEDDVVIPLVGECDDSWLNDAVGRHVRSEHVYRAIEQATGGKVAEGSVGAGTGLITCDFKAGIGTSSRRVAIEGADYTVGVLVLSNFGVMRSLRVDGAPVGEVLEPLFGDAAPRAQRGLDHHDRRHRRAAAVVAAGAPVQAGGAGHRPPRLVRGARLGRDHRRLLDRQRACPRADLEDDRHASTSCSTRPATRSTRRSSSAPRRRSSTRCAWPTRCAASRATSRRPCRWTGSRDILRKYRHAFSGTEVLPAMRICFVVADVRDQQPNYAGVYLALSAHRRGHDVRFVSVDDLSFLDDNNVLATTTRVRAGDYATPDRSTRTRSRPRRRSSRKTRSAASTSSSCATTRSARGRRARARRSSTSAGGCGWRARWSSTIPKGCAAPAAGCTWATSRPTSARARWCRGRSTRLKAFLRELDGPAVLKPLAPRGGEQVFYLRRRQVSNLNQIITRRDQGRLRAGAGVPARGRAGREAPAAAERRADPRRRAGRHLPAARGHRRRTAPRRASAVRGKCDFGPVEARICDILRPKLLADGLTSSPSTSSATASWS